MLFIVDAEDRPGSHALRTQARVPHLESSRATHRPFASAARCSATTANRWAV